jgi:Protein of unknown function (DUF3105)
MRLLPLSRKPASPQSSQTAAQLLPLVVALACGSTTSAATEADAASSAASDAAGTGDAAVGCQMLLASVPNEGATHVPEGSALTFLSNPPASGSHYPVWAQFGAYQVSVPRGYWVHNLEHGAVVFLYGPSASELEIAELRRAFDAVVDPSCGEPRRVLTPDPELPTKVAIVSWDWTLTGDCINSEQAAEFVALHISHGTEQVCSTGSYVP